MAGRSMREMIGGSFSQWRLNKFTPSIIIAVGILVFILAILVISPENYPIYSNTTKYCISCHNDTGFPVDTNNDTVSAPYKRPHNGKMWCETCHNKNPHNLTFFFIQADGHYQGKSTAASCPECHQTGIPAANNSNFTTAFMIPNPMRHSSNINNGSLWGNHWTNTSPKEACIYCHGNTTHNETPMGRILEWFPVYIKNSSIGNGSSCAACHFKGDVNYSAMADAFNSSGLEIPPEITNGTNWNGNSTNYFNHSIGSYIDSDCKQCHGSLLSENATMSEFVHNVTEGASGPDCISCHDIGKTGAQHRINSTAMS